MLNYIIPRSAINYRQNIVTADAKFTPKGDRCDLTECITVADISNIILRQPGEVMVDARRLPSSPLSGLIQHVIGGRPEKEMAWIHARSHIAAVEHANPVIAFALRYWSIVQFPRNAMSQKHGRLTPSSAQPTIARLSRASQPQPAFIWRADIDTFPKTLSKGYSARSHVALLKRPVRTVDSAVNASTVRFYYHEKL